MWEGCDKTKMQPVEKKQDIVIYERIFLKEMVYCSLSPSTNKMSNEVMLFNWRDLYYQMVS